MSTTRRTWLTLAAVLVVAVIALASLSAPTGCSKSAAPSPSVNAANTSGVVYTCPMHPEVTSSKPGECPKCHMALVKKEG